jgi:hypothetical protein
LSDNEEEECGEERRKQVGSLLAVEEEDEVDKEFKRAS